ncbi:MAG: Holliday junction resolvase RecU [Synergistaceae bacterium]|nr:Holliday junction resolvase RecU [Synergistaceae bacterium]
MRRGYEFEAELSRLSKYLNAQGIHMHKNHAKRTEQGIYLEGEPFDYEVISGGVIHCFDAKECAGRRWSLSNAKLSQLNNLLVCHKNGAQAYFLVWYRNDDAIIRFDAELVRQKLVEGQKSLTPEEGEQWEWTELLTSRSVTAS